MSCFTKTVLIACLLGQSHENLGVRSVARCGPHALFVSAAAIDRAFPYSRVGELFPDADKESSLEELRIAAIQCGLHARGVRWKSPMNPFERGKVAAVMPITAADGRRHFVSLIESRGDQLCLVDFPGPPLWTFDAELRARTGWDGTVLYVAADESQLSSVCQTASAGPAWIAGTAMALFLIGFARRRRQCSRHQSKHVFIPSAEDSRAGFTVIELMVSIGVIAVLVSLAAPAVQQARETARGLDCRNRLRQIGLAMQQYTDVYDGTLPPAFTAFASPTAPIAVGHNISPHAQLLPFLDQTAVWQSINFAETGGGANNEPPTSVVNSSLLKKRMPIFECPSDTQPSGSTNYRMSLGTSPGFFEWTAVPAGVTPALLGVAQYWGSRRLASLSDGSSHTACFSERVTGDQNPNRYDPWRDRAITSGSIIGTPDNMLAICQSVTYTPTAHHSSDGATWLLTAYAHTLYNHILTPNSPIPDCEGGPGQAVTARSYHRGGVNVLYVDGSVHLVSESIDMRIWRGIGTIAGNEVISGL